MKALRTFSDGAWLFLLVCTASAPLLGCGNDTGSTEAGSKKGVPDEATLCELMPGKTTLDEAKELLGKPAAQSGAMHDDAAVLAYSFGTSALNLTFVDGVLSDAPTVVGIDYPDCWSSQ